MARIKLRIEGLWDHGPGLLLPIRELPEHGLCLVGLGPGQVGFFAGICLEVVKLYRGILEELDQLPVALADDTAGSCTPVSVIRTVDRDDFVVTAPRKVEGVMPEDSALAQCFVAFETVRSGIRENSCEFRYGSPGGCGASRLCNASNALAISGSISKAARYQFLARSGRSNCRAMSPS